MKSLRTLLASSLLVLVFLPISLKTKVTTNNKPNQGCIMVTVLRPFTEVFLPMVVGVGNGYLLQSEPEIREVTEDTNGCLKFVGDSIHFSLDAGESGGLATVDIGQAHKGINLFDDGTHGDATANDGIYERDYVTLANDVVRSAKITGKFTSISGKTAKTKDASGVVTITDWGVGEISVDPFIQYVTDPVNGGMYAVNRMVIGFVEGTSLENIEGIFLNYNLTLAGWIPELLLFEVELKHGQDYDAVKDLLLNQSQVDTVDRNYAMKLLNPPIAIPDGRMPLEQANYLNPIRAKLGWKITKGSTDVKVAVSDTGADENHPDLIGQIEAFYTCSICSTGDTNGHGTRIAGIIAAENGTMGISGIAPNIRLFVFKQETILGQLVNPYNTAADIVYATKDGARVISLSMGTEYGWPLSWAVKYAHNHNVLMVASVGENANNGQEFFKENQAGDHKVYPASFPEVLAVGSTESDDTIAKYSDYGDQVVYAPVPQSGIISTNPSSGYSYDTGTSYATPQVAALAALILSVNPSLSNDQVVNIITQTADDVDGKPGLGRINVYRALEVASGQPDPGFDPLPKDVTNLYATVVTTPTLSVNLTWTPPSNDYAGVHIYRQEIGSQNIQQLEGGLIGGYSYVDINVSSGSAYEYYAFAVDATGQESVEYDESGTISLIPTSGNEKLDYVSQLGGATFGVDTQGNYAYIGLGTRVGVLDVSKPSNPILIGQSQLLDNLVIDIAKHDNYVYAVTLSGLVVLNVADLYSPNVVNDDITFTVYSSTGQQNMIEVVGNYAYVVTSQSLLVINISNPTSPRVVGRLGIRTGDMAVEGNYAYVINYPDLQIINISDPTSPNLVSSYSGGSLYSVAVNANYVFVADIDNGVRVLDVTDPSNPTEIALIPGNPGTVAVDGNRLYFDHVNFGGLHIFDISNPSAPSELGFLSGLFPTNIKIDGYLYAPDRASLNLKIISVSDPKIPFEVGSYTPITPLGITLRANIAYCGDNSGVRILDVTNPGNPNLLGSYKNWWQRVVVILGNYAYVTDGNNVIELLDVSNPHSPVEVRKYFVQGIAYSIGISGPYAYVANGLNGLRVLSLNNPTNPIEVGSYDTKWDAQNLDVDGDKVYIADHPISNNNNWTGGGLSIVDIKDPKVPVQVSFYDDHAPNFISAIASSGNYLYITYSVNFRLQILDVADPRHPKKISTVKLDPLRELPTSIAVNNGYAFIGTAQGLVVIDVNDPVRPHRVTSYKIGFDGVKGVAVQGDYIFLANDTRGLWILRFINTL